MQERLKRSFGSCGAPRQSRHHRAPAIAKRPGSVSRTWTMSCSMPALRRTSDASVT